MADPHYITLILPAYNEARRISETVRKAKEYFEARRYRHEIIVAADGNDGTRELALEIGKTDQCVKVMGTEQRRGKGIGIREAVMQAQGTIIGFADADNKTPIDEFDKFMPLLSADWKVVIGSRAEPQSTIEQAQPLHRRWGSKGFAVLMHAVAGLRDVKDTQCGFKFFRRQAALELFGMQKIDGYMFDVEILYLARRAGHSIAQVPVRWKDDADSRLQLFRGNLRNAIDLFSIPLMHRKHSSAIELAKHSSERTEY
jgi:dolichyl-phosphate beta-glucosyltransferase